MKLYHGTTETIARKALKEGLLPRNMTGSEGNWEDNPSSSHLVYLTEVYAAYFGFCARTDGENIGIVEVETDLLNEQSMRPDEDFLEQVNRMGSKLPKLLQKELNKCSSMEERTAWFKIHLGLFKEFWKNSVEGLGNAAHYGSILPKAITKVAIFDPKTNPLIFQTAMDPTISILNFRFMADKYRAVTSWLMGNEVTVQEFYGQVGSLMIASDPSFSDQMEKAQKLLQNRSGLEVIENGSKKQNAA